MFVAPSVIIFLMDTTISDAIVRLSILDKITGYILYDFHLAQPYCEFLLFIGKKKGERLICFFFYVLDT